MESPEYKKFPPAQARYLSISADAGGDGMCAATFLQLGPWPCAVERLDDISHGVHNDIELTIAKTGLQTHQLLMQLSRNVVHGP